MRPSGTDLSLLILIFIYLFMWLLWALVAASGISLQPRIKPRALALRDQSLSHWTTGGSLRALLLDTCCQWWLSWVLAGSSVSIEERVGREGTLQREECSRTLLQGQEDQPPVLRLPPGLGRTGDRPGRRKGSRCLQGGVQGGVAGRAEGPGPELLERKQVDAECGKGREEEPPSEVAWGWVAADFSEPTAPALSSHVHLSPGFSA